MNSKKENIGLYPNITSKSRGIESGNKNNASKEIGGFDGPEPTKYGDWQHKGRVTDF